MPELRVVDSETGVNTNMVGGTNNGMKLSTPVRNHAADSVDGYLAERE